MVALNFEAFTARPRSNQKMIALVYHIGKIEASTVILVGTGEHNDITKETTVGDLVDYYKTIDYVEDIVVGAADFPPIEEDADMVTEFFKSVVKVFLYKSRRLHQPKGSVDLKIKGEICKHCC